MCLTISMRQYYVLTIIEAAKLTNNSKKSNNNAYCDSQINISCLQSKTDKTTKKSDNFNV